MKEFFKKPEVYLYLLFVLCVYYTNEALKVAVYYDLIDFAQSYRVLYQANTNFFKGGISFGVWIEKYWSLVFLPSLPYLIGAGLLAGILFYFYKFQPKLGKKLFKKFISVKLAVVIIIILGILSAWGTIVESKFNDADAANKLVYHSVWMYGTFVVMSLQLIGVMIDRWPWKAHHSGFVLAHIGILILLFGSILTRYCGIDGSMAFRFGEASRFVSIGATDFSVHSSFDGKGYTRLAHKDVDFMIDPPSKENPFVINLGKDQTIKVIDYYPYAFRNATVIESKQQAATPAVRVQLEGSQANLSEWITMDEGKKVAKLKRGLLSLTLNRGDKYFFGRDNEILFEPAKGNEKQLTYKIYSAKDKKVTAKGNINIGDVVPTGFMDFQLRLINYFPKHEEKVTYTQTTKKSEMTNSAILVDFNGEKKWMGQNSLLKYYIDNAIYVLSFGNKRVTMDFRFKLKDFRVGRYQGTNRAASYESDVQFPDGEVVNISMNEPMKRGGFTFYQSSFQEDESGRPTMSILSVNRDPGRVLKYLGSLIIFLGFTMLFYFRSYFAKKPGRQK